MSWFKRAFGPKQSRERATKLVTQGFVHAKERRLDDARQCYEEAIDADDSFAVAHLNLGLCLVDLLNRDGAQLDVGSRAAAVDAIADTLERALALDDAPWMGWRALARVEERREHFARAEEAWQKVAEKAPGAEGALGTEARDAVKRVARRAAAERARKRALAACADGVDKAERGAALAELMPLLDDPELGPVLPRGAALAGTLARRAGDRLHARVYLEKAVAADAGDVEALRELASVCLEDGDMERALSASLEAYRERPSDAGLVCNVGVIHLGLGQVDEAAEYIDIAFRLEPKDPIVLKARAELLKTRLRQTSPT